MIAAGSTITSRFTPILFKNITLKIVVILSFILVNNKLTIIIGIVYELRLQLFCLFLLLSLYLSFNIKVASLQP